ncbi:hypothetical protein NFI96_007126 [Prochilodus magdalenae]|nr:hypothetical protein NFI96_007126 [Prochilodus magdalenae]
MGKRACVLVVPAEMPLLATSVCLERKRDMKSTDPKGSSSTQEASHPRDNPEPPADPQHTGKKRKCVAADSELEEGEIMSEEDEEDEDEQHVSVGHLEGEKCAGADRLPHKDEGSSDDDGRQCATAENQKAPMEADPSPRPPGQDQENNDEGAKNGADAVHDQLVTMETTTSSVHGPCEDSDTERADGGTTDEKVATARDVHCGEAGDEGEVATGNGADVADDQKITMETDNPHPHKHEQVAPAVND